MTNNLKEAGFCSHLEVKLNGTDEDPLAKLFPSAENYMNYKTMEFKNCVLKEVCLLNDDCQKSYASMNINGVHDRFMCEIDSIFNDRVDLKTCVELHMWSQYNWGACNSKAQNEHMKKNIDV